MVVFVRHGRTDLNEAGDKKLRGWLPVPLDSTGMKEAHEVAERLSLVKNVKHLYCGTLVRVVQSASYIAEALSMPLEPGEEWNTWDTGEHAGTSVKDTIDKLNNYIKHPTMKVPGGETFQFFLDRVTAPLKKAVESDEINILCTSGRVSSLLSALVKNKGKYPDTETLITNSSEIDPSGVMIIEPDWTISFKTKKSEKGAGLS